MYFIFSYVHVCVFYNLFELASYSDSFYNMYKTTKTTNVNGNATVTAAESINETRKFHWKQMLPVMTKKRR